MYGNQMAVGAEMAREMSPVERATDALRQAGYRQHELLQTLHERLGSVLASPVPQECSKSSELRAAPACAMEEWLVQETDRLNQANHALHDLLSRLRV